MFSRVVVLSDPLQALVVDQFCKASFNSTEDMRLKPVFIITSLLTGHAVGLPRPQERSEENSYDQGDLARDATLVLGTGLVTGGSVWYLNEKSTAKQIEQLKSGQRDMRVKVL